MDKNVPEEQPHGSFATYVTGFVLSIVLTFIPYALIVNQTLTGWTVVLVIMAFAVAQLIVQLVFFLHLGRESGPKWNTMAFYFMVMVVLVVVGGSLWIMKNLDYNMDTSHSSGQTTNLQGQEGF